MFERAPARVLLTGGNGQLGRALRRSAGDGVELLAPDSARLDLRDAGTVRQCLRDFRPDLIINAAAYTQVDRAESEPAEAFAVNAEAVGLLAHEAAPRTRIIHISTDFVFDGQKGAPYHRDDPTNPLNVYGRSKRDGETLLRELKPESSVVIRTSWLYSPDGGNFVKTMLRLMREKPELRVVSDQRGSPTSADSLAQAVWGFARRPELRGIHHWSGLGETSWHEFALAIQQQALALGLLNSQIPVHPIPATDYPVPARRPAYSVLDTRATREALGLAGADWRDELQSVLTQLGSPECATFS